MGASSRRVQEGIARVQSVFAVSAVIFRKFLAAFRAVFADKAPGGKRGARGKKNEAPGPLLHFLWTLYIAAKTKLAGNQAEDVMTCFHLLLCVLDYARRDLVEQGQTGLLNADFVGAEEEDEDGSIVQQLCGVFNGSVLDAKHFHVHWWQGKLESFVVDGLLPTAAEQGILGSPDTYRAALERVYEEAMLKRGEMDERVFLPADPAALLAPAALDNPMLALHQPHNTHQSDTDLLLRMSLQSCLEKISQYRLPTPLSGRSYVIAGDQFCPATPVSAAVAAANRLAALTLDVPRLLRPDVLSLFPSTSSPPPNPPDLIADVLSQSGAAFTDAFQESGLCQETLHRSLIAVAYELVLFSHGEAANGKENSPGSSREFPWILPIVGLQPVHFYKIIELVIRAEAALSRDMVKHLNMVEERVLEELGWEERSAVWELVSGGAEVPACADVAHPSHLPEAPAKRRLDFPDPSPSKLRAVGNRVPAPARGSSQFQATPASALQLFFRKAYYLASVRLQDLSERLGLGERNRQAAWTLLEHCLRSHTDLLKGRHVDQLLMCCVYVVSRLNRLEVSFHDIMSQYRHQPQAHSRVYRLVVVEGEETGDLIQFYNKVFLGRVEVFAKRLPSGGDQKEAVPLSPLPSVKSGGVGLSPRRKVHTKTGVGEGGRSHCVSGSRGLEPSSMREEGFEVAEGVYVSPLALPNVPPSPTRPLRYSFNRSPYKDLKAINSMIRAGVTSGARRWNLSDPLATRRIHLPSNL